MTKKLEEIFELASQEENTDQETNELTKPLPDTTKEVTQEALDNLEKIETALPQVKGLEDADEELDELADLATSSFKDLQDLGMQVDSRFSGDIFGVASNMLSHAITAKTSKLNKKLKMIELQIRKANLDKKNQSKDQELDNTPVGEGQALDRNELLRILNEKTEDK